MAVDQKIDRFFSRYPQRSYQKGQIIVFGGESPEHIFYIKKGRVRMYDLSYRGDEVVVNVFKSPAFFPMSWAINHTENHFFYKTELPSQLHVIPANEALQFVKDDPEVMLDLLSRLYRGMDGLLGRMVHLMSGSARSRLLYELIIECRRFGQRQKDGSCRLDLSETELAGRSGLSRETISREIRKVKDEGLLAVDHLGIHILDLDGLEKKLGATV